MKKLFLVIIIVIILVALFGYTKLQNNVKTSLAPASINSFDESKIKPVEKQLFTLPEGRQHYRIMSGGDYPKITEAEIDPLDVKVGDMQKMTVVAEDPDGIESVVAYIETDNTVNEVHLNYSEGYWLGSWTVYDTHSKNYTTTFVATNNKGESANVTLAWSDPCTPPAGGSWILDDNCAFSGVNGVDNGNLIINNAAYTLTINAGATFAWNSGKEIQISAGTISISNTGQLKQTNLWMEDADSDNYPSNTTQYYGDAESDACPSLVCRRRNLMSSTSTTDCYDSNSSAYPEQTLYFTVNRGDGSFDYDCDSVTTPEFPCTENLPSEGCYSTYVGGGGGWVSPAPACGGSGVIKECTGWSSAGCSGSGLTITCGTCPQDGYVSWQVNTYNSISACN